MAAAHLFQFRRAGRGIRRHRRDAVLWIVRAVTRQQAARYCAIMPDGIGLSSTTRSPRWATDRKIVQIPLASPTGEWNAPPCATLGACVVIADEFQGTLSQDRGRPGDRLHTLGKHPPVGRPVKSTRRIVRGSDGSDLPIGSPSG